MRKFRPALAAVAVALTLPSGAAFAQFSTTYIFGDSLSDAGQYGARFTTNPGLTTAMYLGERYGLASSPSFTGGNDFAQGGARVNSPATGIPPGAPNLSVTQQVQALLAKGPLDPNALYQIQGGANDLLALATAAAGGTITPAQVQAGTIQAATDFVTTIAALKAGGARYVVVYNLPDVGKTPAAISQGQSATFSSLSSLYNSVLNAGIAQANLQVIQVNSFALINEVVANPSAFGFVNVNAPVCTTSSSLSCTPSTLRDPNGAQTWLFADGIHPTTAGEKILSDLGASMIEGPSRMSVLAEAPIGVEQANFRTIDARMFSAIGSSRPPSKYDMYVSYDYSHNDTKGLFLDGHGELNTLTAGGDIKVTPNLLVGGIFGYTDDKGEFGGSNGGYKLRELSGTLYAGYGDGPWYVGATLGAGDLDFNGIRRNIQLGPLSRTESADARGWHFMGSVLGGYWFNAGPNWRHGPWGRVAYQEIRVHGFSESGADSSALSYGEQKRESLITSLGWQVAGTLGMVRPWARVTWENESKNDNRVVSATPVGLNGTYTVQALKPDRDYVRFGAGMAADFGGVTGYVAAQGTTSKSDGDGYSITLGVRVPL